LDRNYFTFTPSHGRIWYGTNITPVSSWPLTPRLATAITRIVANLVDYDPLPPGLSIQQMFYAFSLCTTAVSTIIIVCRILLLGRVTLEEKGTKWSLGIRHRYQLNAIEIIVESSLIWSVVLICALPFEITTNDLEIESKSLYFGALTNTVQVRVCALFFSPYNKGFSRIQGIAPTLIVLRVLLGRARPDDSWSTAKISTALDFGGSETVQDQPPQSILGSDTLRTGFASHDTTTELQEGSTSVTEKERCDIVAQRV
jgi:hypothetical protein